MVDATSPFLAPSSQERGGGGVKVEVKWAGEKIEAECIPRKRLLILQQGKRCSG